MFPEDYVEALQSQALPADVVFAHEKIGVLADGRNEGGQESLGLLVAMSKCTMEASRCSLKAFRNGMLSTVVLSSNISLGPGCASGTEKVPEYVSSKRAEDNRLFQKPQSLRRAAENMDSIIDH